MKKLKSLIQKIKIYMNIKQKTSKEKQEFDLKTFIEICIIILAIWGFYTFIMYQCFPFDKRGTYGDMYGGLNAVFSGLAFAGVIYTIILQRKDLNLQATELKETRKEFMINRLTTVIYKEKQNIDELINNFEWSIPKTDNMVLSKDKLDRIYQKKGTEAFETCRIRVKAANENNTTKVIFFSSVLPQFNKELRAFLYQLNHILDFVQLNISTYSEIEKKDRNILTHKISTPIDDNLLPFLTNLRLMLVEKIEKYNNKAIKTDYTPLIKEIAKFEFRYSQIKK